jgi:ribonuclease HII
MSKLELGIDEAGRGPILGPMVMACVALHEDAAAELSSLGVTDSKRFGAGPRAHAARKALCEPIYKLASHVAVSIIEVAEIDARPGELNQLEREHAARLITAAPSAATIVADGANLFRPLAARFPGFLCVDRAESAYASVAAASLIAKVRRDDLWHEICRRYEPEFGELLQGFAGGGYCNPATRRFLRAYCARYGKLPPEGRRTWPWDFVADLVPGLAPLGNGPMELPGIG